MSKIQELADLNNTEVNPSEQLVKVQPIEQTPFDLISKEGEHFLALGKYRITPTYATENEALCYLDNEFWKVLMDVVMVLIEGHAKYKQDELHN